jgi:hypothetical protein
MAAVPYIGDFMGRSRFFLFAALVVFPLSFFLLSALNVVKTSGLYLYNGLHYAGLPPLVSGQPTIDPNYGFTSQALGARAAQDVLSGKLPLWNPYEGLGSPLLGEMQAAALFPFTWLQVLPHGQELEQAVLQVIAGFGTLLFLRKLGLNRVSACAGAILFQFNGVFAWLRNAIYNPVAFLPWFFLVIESLYLAAAQEVAFGRRLPWAAFGGLVAALAIYAGFPEEVYLYCLLLVLWAGLRWFKLQGGQRWRFLGDLAIAALLGLALSLPALVAFVRFLPDAVLGDHGNGRLYGSILPASALLHYLLPYVYGPIFAASAPDWGEIGGYIGLAPVLFALAALQLPGRTAIKLLLTFWIIVAVSVSHGVPGVYQAFMLLPLTKIAACFRYLNAGWIFCFVVLVALFLDEWPRADRAVARRALLLAAAVGLVAVVVSTILAWPIVLGTWSESSTVKIFAKLSAFFLLAALASLTSLARLRAHEKAVGALIVLLLFEAVGNFAIPYLSYPRGGRIDEGLIHFLQRNVGFQRFVGTEGAQIAPNYGSYLGISQLNWNDLPIPRLAFDYVHENLDPFIAFGLLYLPESVELTDAQRVERKALFAQRYDRYARAGVKFVLSAGEAAYPLLTENYEPLRLSAGERIELAHVPVSREISVASLSVLIGTYNGAADGKLRAELCYDDDCARGGADLASAVDNRPLVISLERPLVVPSGNAFRISFEKSDGAHPVALWMAPLAESSPDISVQHAKSTVRPRYAPVLALINAAADKTRLVYSGKNFSVFELSGVRPYFESPDCALAPVTREEVRVDCPRASRLTRLELALPGWEAQVNGTEAEIRKVDDAFQEVDLPAGSSLVRFDYCPAGLKRSLWLAGAVLIFILAVFARAGSAKMQKR